MRTPTPPSPRDSAIAFDVPSGRGFIALLAAFRETGGTAPAEIVGRLLEEHRVGGAVSLATLIDTGQVFGFRWRDNLWIPMFQFDPDQLSLKTGAHGVRAALPAAWSAWKVASWFAAPNARLDGRTPAAAIDDELDAVLQAAQSMEAAARWPAAVSPHARETVAQV